MNAKEGAKVLFDSSLGKRAGDLRSAARQCRAAYPASPESSSMRKAARGLADAYDEAADVLEQHRAGGFGAPRGDDAGGVVPTMSVREHEARVQAAKAAWFKARVAWGAAAPGAAWAAVEAAAEEWASAAVAAAKAAAVEPGR